MARYDVQLKATTDNKYDGDRLREMLLTANYLVNYNPEKENVTLKTVRVCFKLVSCWLFCFSSYKNKAFLNYGLHSFTCFCNNDCLF